METSLRFDSGNKHLKLFAKEKFCNDDNYVLTVRRPARAGDGPYPTFYPREGRFTRDPPRRRSPARASTPSHGDRPFDDEPRADANSLSIHAAQVSGSLDTRDGRVESRACTSTGVTSSQLLLAAAHKIWLLAAAWVAL